MLVMSATRSRYLLHWFIRLAFRSLGAAPHSFSVSKAFGHAADIQNLDGGVLLVAPLFEMYPFLLQLYADSGYQGSMFLQDVNLVWRAVNMESLNAAMLATSWSSPNLERRAHRCLAKDLECLNRNAPAFLRWASVRLILRKLRSVIE